jgi:hypothetical protein
MTSEIFFLVTHNYYLYLLSVDYDLGEVVSINKAHSINKIKGTTYV